MEQRSPTIAINWGSSNCRGLLIDADGNVIDRFSSADGVLRIDRVRMEEIGTSLASRWPDAGVALAAGMIGSPSGWVSANYCPCPADAAQLRSGMVETRIGELDCLIVPGMSCTAPDGRADVMRGEEVEILGLVANDAKLRNGRHLLILPGTHTKWVELEGGKVTTFFTSISGELYDRLSEKGLLSTLISDGPLDLGAFREGLALSEPNGSGLGRLLFGIRADIMLGWRCSENSSAIARGILIGSEIADAEVQFGLLAEFQSISLCGNADFGRLYQKALGARNVSATIIDAEKAAISGFSALLEEMKVNG